MSEDESPFLDNVPDEHPDPDAAYESFIERVGEFVAEAEDHLQVPHGTIASLEKDESDFLFCLKLYGVVEPLLKEMIREHINRNFFVVQKFPALIKAVLSLSIDQLRKISHEFGIIDDSGSNFLQALALVRNRYAHHISNVHLTIPELSAKIDDATILPKLTGLAKPDEISQLFYRAMIYYNLSYFLQNALHIVRPPPPPAVGLFGGGLFTAGSNVPGAAAPPSGASPPAWELLGLGGGEDDPFPPG